MPKINDPYAGTLRSTAAARLTSALRFVARHRAGARRRRSAGAETHRLPLLLSSMFPLFSALAEYFASSRDLFFFFFFCALLLAVTLRLLEGKTAKKNRPYYSQNSGVPL